MVQSDHCGNKYQFLPFDQIQNGNLVGFFFFSINLLLEFILQNSTLIPQYFSTFPSKWYAFSEFWEIGRLIAMNLYS